MDFCLRISLRPGHSALRARHLRNHPDWKPGERLECPGAPGVWFAMKSLVVDDEDEDRVAVQEILCDFGECDLAENGKEAIYAFQQAWSGGDPYNLVCLDIQMPVLDGFETLKVLREMELAMNVTETERCRIFVIASSTSVAGKDLARSLGCDAYFRKPIKRLLFINRLQTFGLFT